MWAVIFGNQKPTERLFSVSGSHIH